MYFALQRRSVGDIAFLLYIYLDYAFFNRYSSLKTNIDLIMVMTSKISESTNSN
jgi:hypothetical protein